MEVLATRDDVQNVVCDDEEMSGPFIPEWSSYRVFSIITGMSNCVMVTPNGTP